MFDIEVGKVYRFKPDPQLKVRVLNQIDINEWTVFDQYMNIMYRMTPELFADFELDEANA
jgi:hypothetical protein